MEKTLYTKNEVREALGITDFRQMSADKVVELVSLMPQMDKEIALSIIGEFSNYSDLGKTLVKEMGEACDTAIAENKDSQNATINAYRQVLDSLAEGLKDDNFTSEEKMKIADKMVDIADKIASKDTEQKEFIKEIVKYKGYIIGGVLILGVSILGVNVKSGVKAALPKIL